MATELVLSHDQPHDEDYDYIYYIEDEEMLIRLKEYRKRINQ